MSDMVSDPMWSVFKPLWKDLQKVGGDSLLVCGGYGLFLKQKWLLTRPDVLIGVPLAQWRVAQPRVTKDFDVVIGLDLIAEESSQRKIMAVLKKHGFKVTQENPRWQFEKPISENRNILLELHAPMPTGEQVGFETDRIRVKRKPSLHEDGIHGRANAEAIGCDLTPFRFELEGVSFTATNPVTWCVMKLTAMQDQYKLFTDAERSQRDRDFCRAQAVKHAKDVCRIVAMVTRNENDALPMVINSIRSMPQFSKAEKIRADFFQSDGGFGALVTGVDWEPAGMQIIRETLVRWFKESVSS